MGFAVVFGRVLPSIFRTFSSVATKHLFCYKIEKKTPKSVLTAKAEKCKKRT
jgi:hypothetical protein